MNDYDPYSLYTSIIKRVEITGEIEKDILFIEKYNFVIKGIKYVTRNELINIFNLIVSLERLLKREHAKYEEKLKIIEKRINKLNQCKINEQIKEKLNNILLFYQSKVIMRKITE